jgi:hypothetical protein
VSKLADKIRRVSRAEPAPIGFVTSRAAAEATMVLAAVVKHLRDAAAPAGKGADVVLVEKAEDGDASGLDGCIAGGWLGGGGDAGMLKERGFDFVVFDPDDTRSTAVLEEAVGYVMRLPRDVTDTELRAIEAFQLDAIDIGEIDGELSVRRQIDLRRIFALTRKPLMATVRGDIAVPALQALRDTNVVVVTARNEQDVERLRKTIDALPPRSRRKDDSDRPTPLVPRSASVAGDEDDDD